MAGVLGLVVGVAGVSLLLPGGPPTVAVRLLEPRRAGQFVGLAVSRVRPPFLLDVLPVPLHRFAPPL